MADEKDVVQPKPEKSKAVVADSVKETKPEEAYEAAITIAKRVMSGQIDMGDARKLMHGWWAKVRQPDTAREQVVIFRRQLERISGIMQELYTEFQVSSQRDR